MGREKRTAGVRVLAPQQQPTRAKSEAASCLCAPFSLPESAFHRVMLHTVDKGGSMWKVGGAGGTVHLFATARTQPFAGRKGISQEMPVALALGFSGQG